MRLGHRAMLFVAFFYWAFSLAWAQTPQAESATALKPGIVIEKIAKYSEAEKAGLAEGDIILRWSRSDAKGQIQSPFDLITVEMEQAPLGAVALEGIRGSENKVWSVGQDTWGLHARPNFGDVILAIYREGQELAAAGKLREAAEPWRAVAGQAGTTVPAWLRPWLFFHIAALQTETRQWTEADEAYQEAVKSGTYAGPDITAQMLRAWGRTFEQRSDWPHAEQYYRQAMAEKQDTANETLTRAVDLDHLGSLAYKRGNLATADDYYQQALHIREKLAPGSLAIAFSLNNLGSMADYASKLVDAEDLDRQALTIAEKLAPGSLSVADALGNLGDVRLDRSDLAEAGDYYRRSSEIYEKLTPESLDVALALTRLGWVARQRGDLGKSEAYCRQALDIRKRLAPGGLEVAQSLNSLGSLDRDRGDLGKAEAYYRQVLEIRERLAPGSLDVAQSLHTLGSLASDRGDLAKAEAYHLQALAIREKLAPNSLVVASSLNNLGIVAFDRGDLAQAAESYRRALAIYQKQSPDGQEVAMVSSNLGLVAWQHGELAQAEEYHQLALSIYERLSPGGRGVAGALNNLGNVAFDRGQLARAEEYFRGDLHISEKLEPGSLGVATDFNNLGMVTYQRGDLTGAEEYFQQALALRQKLAPGSLAVAKTLNNLGLIAVQRGSLAQAENYHRQALEIREKLAPGSLVSAMSYGNLGEVARSRGNLAQAEQYYLRAMAIQKKIAPEGIAVALSLNRLGTVVREAGDLPRAEEYLRRSLAIWNNLAPGSADQAESLAGLASILRQRGQIEEAELLFQQALNALEGQTARLGGTADVRAGFRAKYASYYQGYIDLLIERKQAEAAFHVLERSRARTLLEMLASAHVDIRKGANPALLQESRVLRENIAAKSDRRLRLLGDKQMDEQIADVDKELKNLFARYQNVEAEIGTASPSYAALTQQQTLATEEIQQLLDASTVLLEYSLGDEHSYLFAVTPDGVAAYELPKRAEIEHVARSVYDLLTARNRTIKGETPQVRQARAAKAERDYSGLARQLSNMLLRPTGAALQGKRLLIVADGALHYIPFAALPDPQDLSKTPAPLMFAHEIVNLPSASVLAVLRSQEHARKPALKAVAVLADPVFSAGDGRLGVATKTHRDQTRTASEGDAGSDRELTRSVRDVGLDLTRLPYTRLEAEAIYALTPPHQGMKALDFNATRAMATSPELSQYRIVHFATHGLLDSQHPELSGLVLSLVDKQGKPQSGFLSLEDIYNLDLPAELVVLSACETGLGKEINGEGLIGLTRGFMYAGANRVVASLWSVNDAATAELMTSFYQGVLRDKLPPAAALRQAQSQMWKRARWKSPYYWAAFQIQGDWK
jgi:CHAT domain-containing protein/Tfp pilus assembly protein PilF